MFVCVCVNEREIHGIISMQFLIIVHAYTHMYITVDSLNHIIIIIHVHVHGLL